MARRLNKQQIIKSIVWPNDEISAGYETLLVETDSGKTHSGVLVDETDDQLTMRIAEGELLTLSKDEIEEREQKKASSMPEGLIKTIAPIDPAWSFLGSDVSRLARQARQALSSVRAAGEGVVVLMHQNGGGMESIEVAYARDFAGADPSINRAAAEALRDLGAGCQILLDIGCRDLRLLASSVAPSSGWRPTAFGSPSGSPRHRLTLPSRIGARPEAPWRARFEGASSPIQAVASRSSRDGSTSSSRRDWSRGARMPSSGMGLTSKSAST